MDFSLIELFAFFFVGILATSYGVLVGAGGGFIIGPTLMLFFDFSPQSAVGTSILCVSIASLSGAISYLRLKIVDIRSTILFAIAAMPGAILAVIGLEKINSAIFNILFALILLLTGLYVYWSPSKSEKDNNSKKFENTKKTLWLTKREINSSSGEKFRYIFIEPIATSVNIIFGFISSFFGIGGGPLRTPTLVYFFNFPVKVATATSVATMSIYTLFGSFAHYLNGNVEVSAVIPLGLGGIIGSQIGVIISKRLKGRLVMKLLSVAMIVIAISMAIEGFNNF